MATITYRCDTCEREITLSENANGMTVFGKCNITLGCKGTLYKLIRNPNIIREEFNFPPPVVGLNDFVPRRVFFKKEINITTNSWKIQHNLGVSPAVTVYFFDENTNLPFEVSPDDYVVNITDKNNLEISFNSPRKGIVHLIARSSVPREITTITETEDLFQVSNLGHMVFVTPSVINDDILLIEDDFDLFIEVQIPSNPTVEVEDTFLTDTLHSSSPWFGWNQVLIRKRRNFTTKNLQILDVLQSVSASISTLNDIPDGTSFQIQQIKYRNENESFEGNLIDIEPRSLFLLLANEPYGIPDKIRNQIIDVGELLISEESRFFIFDGEVFIDNSNIEKTYPRIEQTTVPAI